MKKLSYITLFLKQHHQVPWRSLAQIKMNGSFVALYTLNQQIQMSCLLKKVRTNTSVVSRKGRNRE